MDEPSAYELWLARVDELAGHLQDLERQDVPVIFGLDHADRWLAEGLNTDGGGLVGHTSSKCRDLPCEYAWPVEDQ